MLNLSATLCARLRQRCTTNQRATASTNTPTDAPTTSGIMSGAEVMPWAAEAAVSQPHRDSNMYCICGTQALSGNKSGLPIWLIASNATAFAVLLIGTLGQLPGHGSAGKTEQTCLPFSPALWAAASSQAAHSLVRPGFVFTMRDYESGMSCPRTLNSSP